MLIVGINYAPEQSGIAPYTAAMARGLAERGHDVHVLTTKPHYPQWRVPAGYEGGVREERIDGVRVTRLPHYVPTDPTGLRRLLSEISFGLRVLTARWGRTDVVVFVSPALFSSWIAMLRAKLLRLRSVVWIQDLYSLGIVEAGGVGVGGPVVRIVQAVERRIATAADAVTVIHDRFADSVERLGAAREKITIVRNWSHVPPGRRVDRTRIRAALGWADDEIVALHTGNMGLKQDLGNLVDAARLVRRDDAHPVRFVVMGDGSQRAKLEQAARGSDAIEFVDGVPEERYLATLQAADVLIVNEASGLRDMAVPSKLTSYFAAGRPVLAATDPSSITAAEVAAAGAGVRVDPGRPEALLETVRQIAADEQGSALYGSNGVAYRNRVLTEQVAIDSFEALIERLRRRSDPEVYGPPDPPDRPAGGQERWAIVSS